ncbi:DMT family transporter [Ruminiclostridium josui]|uniref:DMT family transporter n=1 Tax=Ruminiclostridium josui TaxID=1499 RepID=UPI0004637465|nr:DMT family transporter [Ruminiclostridium josui]
MKKDSLIKGMIFCFLAVVAWGGMFPIAGVIMKSINPFHFTAIRYFVAGIIFLILLFVLEGKKSFSFDGSFWKLFFFGTMGFAGYSFLTFGGQKLLGTSGAVVASILMALMPINTVIVNTILGKAKPKPFTMVTIIFALAGVMMVITKGNINNLLAVKNNLLGDILIFLGTICWVIYTIGGTSFSSWSPIRYTSLSCSLGVITVCLLTAAGTAMNLIAMPSLNDIVSNGWQLGYMALIAGVMAVFLWNYGNKIITPINGILFMNLVPVTTFIISLFLGTSFKGIELCGAVLTICSLIANNIYTRFSVNIAEKEKALSQKA